MKRYATMLALLCAAMTARAADEGVHVSSLSLDGEIEGENIIFTLKLDADARERHVELPLVAGDVAYLDGSLPRRSELVRQGSTYALRFSRKGEASVSMRFASRATRDGDWRWTRFELPAASIRKLSVLCDRDDLEIVFPGALDVQREKRDDGSMLATAYLGVAGQFEVRWKPEVKKLDAELVVACDANTIAAASVGALRLDTVLTYRVIQGRLERLSLLLPDVNVTQVRGENIQDWRIVRDDPQASRLEVVLSRPTEGTYRLQIESELVLPEFPCDFALPVFAPESVIRSSGFVMIGSDSAVKLQVRRAAGVTQVDQEAFPAVVFDTREKRSQPSRSLYAYQYANTPYAVELTADDIVTSLTADDRIVVNLAENELVATASFEVDVKDAPARDLTIDVARADGWTVTAVTGSSVAEADVDVDISGDTRTISIPFKQAVTGALLVTIRMEKSLTKDTASFDAPVFTVKGGKSERGYIVLAAEQGIRLKTGAASGMRDVHTGSAPMRVVGAQQAFRFREPGWSLSMLVERATPAIHSEVFHLVSVGEGVAYYSVAITYHIGGAPIQEFELHIPESVQTPELTGSDIEGWTRTGDRCTVRLQERIIGDYTLLVTYDRQFPDQGADIDAAPVMTLNTESEVGYIAVASSLSLDVTDASEIPASVIVIDRGEIPPAYSAPVTDPILRAYKILRNPHAVVVRLAPYDTEQLLGQICDYVELNTRLSRDGESVTTVRYYIKNASRQHLVVRLPEGADLWSIRQLDEKGVPTDLLSQESEQGLLIPVSRPLDPNTPIEVRVTYAQKCRKLGFWRTGIHPVALDSPVTIDTHGTFATWTVQVPNDVSIARARGNMQPAVTWSRGGIVGALGKFCRLGGAILDGPRGRTIAGVLRRDRGTGEPVELKKTVSLSGSGALAVKLWVVPSWMGRSSSVTMMLFALGVGIIVCCFSLVRGGSRAWRALGLTLVAIGLAQSALGRTVLAGLLGVALGVYVAGWIRRGLGRARRRVRRAHESARRFSSQPSTPPPIPVADDPPFEPDLPADSGQSGHASLTGMLLALALACVLGVALADEEDACPLRYRPTMDAVVLSVDGPVLLSDTERSADVTANLEFTADEPCTFVVAAATAVLKEFLNHGDDDLEVTLSPQGYILNVKDKGTYRVTLVYQVPVAEKDAVSSVSLFLPDNMKNAVTLMLPEVELDVNSDDAVLFKTEEHGGLTVVEAVFGPTRVPRIEWRARVRKTKLEKALFFCEVNTLAVLQSGVIDLVNLVRYQVAQGEVRELQVLIPQEMSVTAVDAPGLATWSFDPASRELEAILEQPVTGDFSLVVTTQLSREGLPYTAVLGVPRIPDAARQRGSLAIGAPDSVQVKMGDVRGLSPMNIEDFSSQVVASASKLAGARRSGMTIRRSFRYHQAEEVAATVSTEQVLPEIRVVENGTISIADERIVLATRITLAIARSGIFSVELRVPADFEVESLTGPDVSHWDDSRTDENPDAEGQAWRSVVIHFNRRVTDSAELNLVVARMEKGIEKEVTVPRVVVIGASKHTGRLTLSGERGVRMMVRSHSGVDIKKASEEGIRQAGVLVFDILRPTWQLALTTDVMAPVVKPDVLHWIDLTEGMLQCRAYFRFKIENAGIKTFRIQSPYAGATLTVTGRNIARVHEVDADTGIWEVDLHGKVENLYTMVASYQMPYDPDEKSVSIRPLRALDTDGQRGYLVVTCGGRVQVKALDLPPGLKREDPRNIPAEFGAGDLSSAIQCYRTVRADYELVLSVVRHESADVLPASIDRVRLTSVLSANRRLLTKVDLLLTVGDLRFLQLSLPNKDDELWTVLVNGRETAASRAERVYRIPLEQEAAGKTSVELIYAGRDSSGRLARRQKYVAPKFVGLPLNDIEWVFYVSPSLRYHSFGGTLTHEEYAKSSLQIFNTSQYLQWNKRQREQSLQIARQVLDQGEKLAKAGKQKQAQKAYQQALNYSQAQADLNEDARVQLRNLMKQQVKVGLVNRRDAVRFQRNIIDEQQLGQMQGFRDGDYTQEYVASVERRLSAKDNRALEALADKIIDQQTAAAGVVTAIRITMPVDGTPLRFTRALQIDPEGELEVSFKAGRGWMGRYAGSALVTLGLFAVAFIVVRRR